MRAGTSTPGLACVSSAPASRRFAPRLLALALPIGLACATPQPPAGDEAARHAQLRIALEAGEELYRQAEYVRAAERFRSAVDVANALGRQQAARNATAAECTSWLLARCLPELGDCTRRLEWFVRRERNSDPGVNTLLALGALADGRPLPSHPVPAPVHEMLRATAAEVK